MNSKKVTILVIFSIAILALVSVFVFLRSNRSYEVVFSAVHDETSAIIDVYEIEGHEIVSENMKKIESLQIPGTISLKNGEYVYLFSSKDYKLEYVKFSVSGEKQELKVEPLLKDELLISLLGEERAKITSAINESYIRFDPFRDSISGIKLYRSGNWASANLTSSRVAADIYHIILKKTGSGWEVQNTPMIVISSLDYPEIPKDILSSVNSDQSQDNTSENLDDGFTGDGAPPTIPN